MGETFVLKGEHMIAGSWARSSGAGVRPVAPATGETLEPAFLEAGPAEVEAAMRVAADAFARTINIPSVRWAELLETIADEAQAREAVLIERAKLETALPDARLKGEMGRTTGQLRLFAKIVREGSWVDAVIDTADPARQPAPKPDLRRMRRPVGPVVIFDASNFPFAFGACGGDTASALAAGNPVVIKAHPGHPGVDEIFADAALASLRKLELPLGMFTLLQGAGTEIGGLLVRHPLTEAVGFTGSQRGGRALFDLAAARTRPIPVYAEMGSLNPLVVLPGALAERGEGIADGLAQSVTMGGGQFCTKPGLVFTVEGEAADRFTSRLADNLTALPAATLLNAGIRKKFETTLEAMRATAGVESPVTGQASGNAGAGPSLVVTDSATWRKQQALHEEAFGPATLLVRCRSLEDLLTTLGQAEGQLTGTLHVGAGDPPEQVRRVAQALERTVGRVIFNGYPTGVEVGYAMVHGGPYPATTAAGTTSVGTAAIERFARPVAFQNVPDAYLPPELQNANPLGILRHVDGHVTRDPIPA